MGQYTLTRDDKKRRMDESLAAAKARAQESKAKAQAAPRGERTVPETSLGDIWGDVGLSALSGARSGLEQIAGLGDISNLQQKAAAYVANKFGISPEAAATVAKYTSGASLFPTSEDIGKATDRQVARLPEAISGPIQAVTRHESSTPFGQAANLGGNLGTGMIGGPETLAMKLLGGKGLVSLAALPLAVAKKGGLLEEAVKFRQVFDPAEFHAAVGEGQRAAGKWGAMVEQKAPEEYANTRMYLTDDGKTGFAIKPDGDLVSVFSTEKGRFQGLMQAANRRGASKLDAFDTKSVKGMQPGSKGLWEKYGEESSGPYLLGDRLTWDDQYAPPLWNRDELGPGVDIGMMKRETYPQQPAGATQKVDATLGDLNRPDVFFEGVQPSQFTPSQFFRFGEHYGSRVPLGPQDEMAWYQSLQPIRNAEGVPYKNALGNDLMIPGGLESTDPFTYWDDLYMKAQGIPIAQLDETARNAIHTRTVAGKAPPPGGWTDEDVFNHFLMGMTSPNNPLTPNEFAVAAAMAKGPEDLRRIAEMGPDFRLNSKYMGTQKAPADPAMGGSPITPDARREVSNDIMRQVGVNEGAEGGLGVGGSQDWTYISELAQMMREKPEFFRFRGAQEGGATHEENWMNFVDRIITQVPGLKAKTGSFGGVWQDPVRAGTSAVDRHMLAILGDNLFSSPREAASFKRQMVKDWNSSVKTWNKANPKARPRSRINAVEDLATTPGGTDYFNEKMFGVVNAVSEPKMRVRGTGDVNEAIPPHLHPDQADYVYEPDKAVLTSEAYKRAQQATAQTAARPGSTGLFSDQWYVWDPQRRRFEPHEIKNPGLTSVPRQSQRQLQEAYQAHNEAGYLDYSKDAEGKLNPVQPVTFKEGEALTEPRQQMATILGGLNPSRLAAFQWLAALLGGGAASGLALSRRQRPAGSDRAPLVGGT